MIALDPVQSACDDRRRPAHGPPRRARGARHQAASADGPGGGRAPGAAVRPPARRPRPAPDARGLPGGLRQVDAARGVARARDGVPAGGVGDAGRRRRGRGGPVVARDRGALPRLPGAARARSRHDGDRRPVARGAPPAAGERARRAPRRRAGPRRRAPADERRRAGRASRGSSTTRPRRRRSSSPRAPIPPYRSVRCAPTASWSRSAPTICASRPARPTSSSTAGSGSPWAPRTSSCWSRARRAGPRACTSPRSRSRAARTSRRWSTPSTARSPHVVDFLSTEVLSAYDPELQRFMLRTSVLERLCAELCDAVLGTTGSGDVLERLARTNLFLLPLDDQRRWFRFHHLFAQLLRVELERREPERARALHRRAAAWHAGSGTTDEAVHHALAADAYDEAGALVAGAWIHYVNAGPDVVGARLAGPLPRRGGRRRRRAPARPGVGVGAARARARHAPRDRPRARARRPRGRAAARRASPRWPRASASWAPPSAGATCA